MRWLAVIGCLFILACSSRPVPPDILTPDEMKLVVMDMMKADEYINEKIITDSTIDAKRRRIELYEQVFRSHSTGRKEFYKSYSWYQQHPDLYKTLFDSLNDYGTRIKSQLEKATVDTANKQ